MLRLRHKLLIHFMRFVDQAIVVLCLGLFGGTVDRAYTQAEVAATLVALVVSVLVFTRFVRYDVDRFTPLRAQLLSVIAATTVTMGLMLVIGEAVSFSVASSVGILRAWAAASALVVLIRVVIRALLKRMRSSGLASRQVLIVGCDARARQLAAKFDNCPELGYRIQGFVAETAEATGPREGGAVTEAGICGRITDLQTILERRAVDEIFVCLSFEHNYSTIAHVVRLGEQLGVVVRLIPDADGDRLLRRTQLEFFDGQYVVTFFREKLLYQLMVKRIFDVGASLVLLTVLSPLLGVIALLIKVTSPGPVFYVQERVGMNRRRFNLFKFRSMCVDADEQKRALVHLNEMDGPVFKIKNDPRVTPIGHFIRKTSIDELPQLFNVLGGSMSLVGPRPPVPEEVEQYKWLFQQRLSIKPGITCLWQVSGRNELSFKEWMELDKKYIANWSLWLDFKILCRTIPVVLIGRGAS